MSLPQASDRTPAGVSRHRRPPGSALRRLAACAVGLVALGSVQAGEPPTRLVRDLHYGDVLFYFYQQDYFSAITRLSAAIHQDRVPNHVDDAELLLGGLYLSYGQHDVAGEVFARLLDGRVPDDVRDRAWFYLAKIWFQRGYLERAGEALGSIRGRLPAELAGDRAMLAAQLAMAEGRYADAAAQLADWQGPEQWRGYAMYNLGIALVRQGQTEDGARLLEQVGTIQAGDEERRSLRDKANVAVGYAYLQADLPEAARAPLRRVRLDGPFSNKALLGVGWADSASERYESALVPWMELRHRDLLDAAVQESLLAIPYAFARLDAQQQAAEHYLEAIEAYGAEMTHLDRAIDDLREGRLLETLLEADRDDRYGWFWQLEALPDGEQSRYLYHLLAGHRFQEALKNYRDLRFLERNLAAWAASLEAFDDMLETRRVAYTQRLPVVEASLSHFDLPALSDRQIELESRLAAIEREQDPVGLATSRERRQWARLAEIETRLAALPEDPRLDEIRAKHRLLKGILYWDASHDYKARAWQARRDLRELDRVLLDARKRDVLVGRARLEAPARTEALAGRVTSLQPQIAALRARVERAVSHQQDFLSEMAIAELRAQHERLSTYLAQARFALATIYDRSASLGALQ